MNTISKEYAEICGKIREKSRKFEKIRENHGSSLEKSKIPREFRKTRIEQKIHHIGKVSLAMPLNTVALPNSIVLARFRAIAYI